MSKNPKPHFHFLSPSSILNNIKINSTKLTSISLLFSFCLKIFTFSLYISPSNLSLKISFYNVLDLTESFLFDFKILVNIFLAFDGRLKMKEELLDIHSDDKTSDVKLLFDIDLNETPPPSLLSPRDFACSCFC